MLMLHCPFCGLRPHSEFDYGGDTSIKPKICETMDEYADAVYGRKNINGLIEEYWYHHYGCRQWITIKRHTKTHEMNS